MLRLSLFLLAIAAIAAGASSLPPILPNDWVIRPPGGLVIRTDTMPQGAAASPDRTALAVLDSGFNQPTLHLYRVPNLRQLASIPLSGAFGRPLWLDGQHVLVAGANADALFDVNIVDRTVRTIELGKGSYPTAVAKRGGTFAVAIDGELSARIGNLDDLRRAKDVRIGGHIGGLAFSADGRTLFASNRSNMVVDAIDTRTLVLRTIPTGLHPSDLLIDGPLLYVAESDADTVGIYDAATGARSARIFVGDTDGSRRLAGVSPNAIARDGNTIYASLGAANSVAIIRHGRVVGRLAAGWYPTDVVPIGGHVYVTDGKGEGTRPNPKFKGQGASGLYDYIASIEFGSIRVDDLSSSGQIGNPQGSREWNARAPAGTIVRKGGPIAHVFFILKENRSYDEILGDMREGDGDPKLAWFGARVTPNEHALAKRFGLFDNAFTSGEVSETGHDWSDAGFVDDYVERTWPLNYALRGNNDASLPGVLAVVPKNGYIWQDARAGHVSFRDYGEMTNIPEVGIKSLDGAYDPHYVSWDLAYSDVNRAKEWRREFETFVKHGDVPQFEYIWLPNDHTAGSRAGMLTPAALIAQNDSATGLIVDAISHSPIWRSSAIFIIEDDAQDGPDHVSDQRTTLFVVSPYSRDGLHHAHYSTVSVLRTMEIMLGLPPLSTYDAMALPLYGAFTTVPDVRPYDALAPQVSVTARNTKTAYGARLSAALDFSRPDAVPDDVLNRILAHNREACIEMFTRR